MDLPSTTLKKNLTNFSISTLRRRNMEWFEEGYMKKRFEPIETNLKPTIFEPGKLYTFTYPDPKYSDTLPFYDAQPMTLFMGYLKKGGNPFGINLSYFPSTARTAVLDRIVRVFRRSYLNYNKAQINRGKVANQKVIPMSYDMAKTILEGSGFEFTIRSYIPSLIASQPEIITYEDWWRTLTFNSQFIQKMNIQAVLYQYRKSLSGQYKVGKRRKTKLKDIKVSEVNKMIKNKQN